jgi:acyl-CoA thioesterase-2
MAAEESVTAASEPADGPVTGTDGAAGPVPFESLLALEETSPDVFRAPVDDWPGGRVFGGLVAAQALRAAATTVAVPHAPHSLHAYFVRAGRPGTAIDHAVTRTRDGRSFTTRQVEASQDGEVIFTMAASFHRAEEGPEYQLPMAADVPGPEVLEGPGWPFSSLRGGRQLELREAPVPDPGPDGTYVSTRRAWMRAHALGEDPVMHACVLTFMSDMGVVMAARPPRDRAMGADMLASLDHALWFHRPARADQWLLYDMNAVIDHGARGLVRGVMHEAGGRLVASVSQEVLIRPLRLTSPTNPPAIRAQW